jgi:soluble cytochrome b562
VTQEAVAALEEATDALRFLDEGKHDEAVTALERSVGKLEILLRRAPDLALVPVDVSTTVYDVTLDRRSIEEAIDDVERLVDQGRIQEARTRLNLLRSEIVTSTSHLPMATFPDAIASVAPLIDEGEYDEAKSRLAATLNTVVVIDHVTALPVLRAELLLDEAETLAEESDRSNEESERLANLLDSAEQQLRIAEALGYGEEEDFEPLYDELESIREQTRGGESDTGLFTELRSGINELVDKIAG